MLQAAKLACRPLGASADLVRAFLFSRLTEAGGFADRSGAADIYYTVFGLEALMALDASDIPWDLVHRFLLTHGDGSGLDYVHCACLARCWADMPAELASDAPRGALVRRIEQCRSEDGGYNAKPGCASGTAYAAFIAATAYGDLGADLPDRAALLRSLEALRAEDGGYSNQAEMRLGLTPSTAAVAAVLRQLGEEPDPGAAEWLLERCPESGGFYATPLAPIPDLLSTATALHALAAMGASLDPIRERCLDYLDSLWSARGGFHGNWTDDELDCEYTYYGLLALGHLSE